MEEDIFGTKKFAYLKYFSYLCTVICYNAKAGRLIATGSSR